MDVLTHISNLKGVAELKWRRTQARWIGHKTLKDLLSGASHTCHGITGELCYTHASIWWSTILVIKTTISPISMKEKKMARFGWSGSSLIRRRGVVLFAILTKSVRSTCGRGCWPDLLQNLHSASSYTFTSTLSVEKICWYCDKLIRLNVGWSFALVARHINMHNELFKSNDVNFHPGTMHISRRVVELSFPFTIKFWARDWFIATKHSPFLFKLARSITSPSPSLNVVNNQIIINTTIIEYK